MWKAWVVTFLFCCAVAFGENPEWCKNLPRAANKQLERVLPEEPWYEVYRVQPDVYAIYEPRQFEEVISYLIVGSKRAILLDTGMGIASIRKIVKSLTSLPVTVLNTHTHPDHIGGNAEFENVHSFDIPFSRKNAAEGYSDPEMKDWVGPESVCSPLPPGFDPSSYKIRKYSIAGIIKNEERIDLGGRELQVIATPGHTPDSLCLLDEKNGLLFTGDTFYKGPLYLYTPETNLADYLKSVEKLAALHSKLKMLLPAHNEISVSPDFLLRLPDAVKQVQAGKIKPNKRDDGLREFSFDGFQILLGKD